MQQRMATKETSISVIQFETIQEEKPYRGYRVRRVTVKTPASSYEAVLCECEGKRSVLAYTLALAKRTIDAREGFLKEGSDSDEGRDPQPGNPP